VETDQPKKARAVRDMFSGIAPRYDLLNRLMTAGMDVAWRRQVIQLAQPAPQSRLLDLGAGTGDLAREALRVEPACQICAADFSFNMMLTGKTRHGQPRDWAGSDALNLPFESNSFDGVVSGFLVRNVVDMDRALNEQLRVLKPGGRMVCLDTTRPRKSLFSPLIRFYMLRVIPLMGALIAGNRFAYSYLPQTSREFLPAEEFLARIQQAGFQQAKFRLLNFKTVAIHWAVKPVG